MIVTIVCSHCGEKFKRQENQVQMGANYCSRSCAREARKIDKSCVCTRCGKVFIRVKKAQRYCSRACASASTSGEREATKRALLNLPPKSNFAKAESVFSLFECPWKTGAVPPDEYGREMYRMPDFGCGF